MSKFIVIKNYYGTKCAIRKTRIDSVIENTDKDDDELTTIWVGENQYGAVESFEAIMAKLEE
jgi:hypothetical protein